MWSTMITRPIAMTPWRGVLPCLAALLLVLGALAGRPALAEAPLAHGKGLLWKIESEGAAPSYLYGTMHVTDPDVTELPVPVWQAFERARSVTLEMVFSAEVIQRMGTAMLLANGRTLETILGPERFDSLAAVANRYGFPRQALQLFKPWAAMMMFSVPPEEMARNASGTLPLDRRLQQEAQQRGKPVHGLESVEEQMGVFESVPEAEQISLLDLSLQENAHIERWYQRMKQAYLARDTEALYRFMQEQTAGSDPALMQAFEDRLIHSRNRRMAGRMTGLLNEGNAFIAVGALHLPGESGILRLLEREGRRVTRVY